MFKSVFAREFMEKGKTSITYKALMDSNQLKNYPLDVNERVIPDLNVKAYLNNLLNKKKNVGDSLRPAVIFEVEEIKFYEEPTLMEIFSGIIIVDIVLFLLMRALS